jgi:phosphoribosylanthranilate isomerase
MRTWVKFCGCTSLDDVRQALQAGADAFGLIFAPSPRQVTMDAAREIAQHVDELPIQPVVVVVDPTESELEEVRALFPSAIFQFSGSETAEMVAHYAERSLKAIHVDESVEPADIAEACRLFPRALILFDAKSDGVAGGTGRVFPWQRVAPIVAERNVVIAGGLTPDNVSECVTALRPFGVDVRSGVETDGRKDPAKMRAFVEAVRTAGESFP